MTSTNLKSHLDALASQIALCQQEEIAEPNTWIERFSVVKSNGKRYVYFRLMSATTKRSKSGKIQGQFKCYLGSARSAKYKAARAAIERRNHLRHLQKQYQRLLGVMLEKLSRSANAAETLSHRIATSRSERYTAFKAVRCIHRSERGHQREQHLFP